MPRCFKASLQNVVQNLEARRVIMLYYQANYLPVAPGEPRPLIPLEEMKEKHLAFIRWQARVGDLYRHPLGPNVALFFGSEIMEYQSPSGGIGLLLLLDLIYSPRIMEEIGVYTLKIQDMSRA
ncbi:hypothetical protein TWF730_008766 [Orbilia blumenaviensis]|uniref:Uncharacterized protein n=1 Tax=Orbilia blumenaviensis TaxID=1796055 RepID=A0AAV9V750_9PEZI